MMFHRKPAPHNAWVTLKALMRLHNKKLLLTFGLVIAENTLLLTYPLFAGFAINAIIGGNVALALVYALIVLLMWFVGAARRSADTRVFSRIYAELAVPVIITQRESQHSQSTVAARVALSREFVDFFEVHLPVLLTSLFSVSGAVLMLMVIEFWAGFFCLAILLVFSFFLTGYIRKNEYLYNRLNNRLEKEVGLIGQAKTHTLIRHYAMLSRLRIRLSDREAWGYLSIGVAAALLFGAVILLMLVKGYSNAGHIYSVMTYLWMFVMSLDDAPQLLEKFSKLKDIGKRINTGLT
jgi:hypothetical protein